MLRIGPSVTNLGYNLHDSWWGVPRFGVVLANVPVQLDKLREVRLPSEHILDTAPVKVKTVSRQLKPGIGNPAFHVRKKAMRCFSSPLADNARHNQLAFRVKGDKGPLIAKIGRVTDAHLPLFLTDKAPDFVGLYVADTDIANEGVQLRFCSLRWREHSFPQASSQGL
jgi:hypothetical protein